MKLSIITRQLFCGCAFLSGCLHALRGFEQQCLGSIDRQASYPARPGLKLCNEVESQAAQGWRKVGLGLLEGRLRVHIWLDGVLLEELVRCLKGLRSLRRPDCARIS